MEDNVRSLRETYVTLSGEELVLPPGKPRQFLTKVRRAAEDPSVDVDAITDMVWSHQNPLLTPSPVSGVPMATRETYEHPAFRAMLDCISIRRAAAGDLDLSAAAKKYTMTVQEAAKQLGVHVSTVRTAIRSGRLSAWRKGGIYFLDPASIDAYQVSTRGQRAVPQIGAAPRDPTDDDEERPMTEFLMGTDGDHVMRVKYKGPAADLKQLGSGRVWGLLPETWRTVAVLTGNKATQKFWLHILSHNEDAEPQSVTFGDFHIRGRFQQESIRRERNKTPLDQWEAFQPE